MAGSRRGFGLSFKDGEVGTGAAGNVSPSRSSMAGDVWEVEESDALLDGAAGDGVSKPDRSGPL